MAGVDLDGIPLSRAPQIFRLLVFTVIWGPDFRASIIILTHMLKQIKQNENYLDDDVQSQYQSTRGSMLICTQRRGTRVIVIVVLFILLVASSMHRVVCLEGVSPDFQS